jgi:hypothetical protein
VVLQARLRPCLHSKSVLEREDLMQKAFVSTFPGRISRPQFRVAALGHSSRSHVRVTVLSHSSGSQIRVTVLSHRSGSQFSVTCPGYSSESQVRALVMSCEYIQIHMYACMYMHVCRHMHAHPTYIHAYIHIHIRIHESSIVCVCSMLVYMYEAHIIIYTHVCSVRRCK